MTTRPLLVPSTYVLLRRNAPDGRREVLLQLRQGTGYMDGHWACGAAGHVEGAESVLATAGREALEELGVTLHEDDLIPLSVLHRRGGEEPIEQRVDFFFACDVWEGEPATQEPDKSAALEWYSIDTLPEPIVPHERLVLEGLASGDLAHVMTVGFPD